MYIKVGENWYDVQAPEQMDEAYIDGLDPDKVKKALDNKRRFDPIHKKVNTKSIGSRKKTSDEKNIMATYLQALKPGADRLAYDKAKTAWIRYREVMRKDFQGLARQLANGKITKNQFIARSRTLFKAGYEKAYRLGTDASGLDFVKLPSEDLAWLKRARSSEYKFLNKFADDMIAGKGSMSYEDRASMYIDSIDSTFDAGRVDAYPNEGTKIYWELSPSENCGDCIDLAMNSPYTPDTLPTTPRAGGTMCLSRCNCHLRVRYDRPTSIPLDVKPASKAVAKALGVLAVAKAIQHTAKGGDKAKVKVADLEPDLEPDWELDLDDFGLESVKALDWNQLDEMVSALTTLRVLEEKGPSAHRVRETSIALDKFEKASQGLPNWLDPFSREVYIWHAIGTVVLDYIKEARKKEKR